MTKKLLKALSYLVYLVIVLAVLVEIVLQNLYSEKTYIYTYFRLIPDERYWEGLIGHIPRDGYYVEDDTLGWTVNQNSVFRDSLYVSNSEGVRSDYEYSIEPGDSVLRIALFGDSFTHGDEVYNSEIWGEQLHQYIEQQGITNEVLNFGVSGYGIGQAYLRFQNEGKNFHPDIVVLGFQIEDVWRTLNIFRPNYFIYSGFPFTKPRATVWNDSLHFINVPTVPLDSVTSMVKDWENHPLYDYEYFHHNTIYTKETLIKKSLVGKILTEYHAVPDSYYSAPYSESDEAGKVLDKLLDGFKNESSSISAHFLVLQLPLQEEIESFSEHGASPNEAFLNTHFRNYDFLRTDSLLVKYPIEEIYNGHFTPFGNKIIGEWFGEQIIKQYSNHTAKN